MKIVYFGSSSFGIPSLEALRLSRHELAHVFTQPARPTGRGKKVRPTDVEFWARDHNFPFTEAQNVNAPDMLEKIRTLDADLLVVIAFGQYISQKLITLLPNGAINVHGSLLPEYRGAAPIHHAILDGKTETGITIITLAREMDAGFMLAKAATPIEPEDNAGTVHDRLANLAAPVLLETIEKIEQGTAEYTPQDDSKATFASKLTKEMGRIDFHQPVEVIFNKIRGLWPWPGAQAEFQKQNGSTKEKVLLAESRILDTVKQSHLEPGTLDADLNIVCRPGLLRLQRLRPAGKAMMNFRDFVNGRHIEPGDRFLSVRQSKGAS